MVQLLVRQLNLTVATNVNWRSRRRLRLRLGELTGHQGRDDLLGKALCPRPRTRADRRAQGYEEKLSNASAALQSQSRTGWFHSLM